MSYTECPRCGLRTKGHNTIQHCLKDAIWRLNNPDPAFDLSTRRIRFIPNWGVPESGQYVLCASFGDGGQSVHDNATHTVSLCIDEPTRLRLIEILQVKP